MYKYYNPNPTHQSNTDCVIRAISKLMNKTWDEVYILICLQGFIIHDMPSTNRVWGRFLYNNGYRRYLIPDTCPSCYTVKDFCVDHPYGKYLLALDGHVIAAVDGEYFDTTDTGHEVPIFYWKKVF